MLSLKNRIRYRCLLASLLYWNKYNIFPKYNIVFAGLDDGIPACCSMFYDTCDLIFDLDQITCNWMNYVNYIAMHEVAHRVESELNKNKNIPFIAGGHNKTFCQLIHDIKDYLTEDEWNMFKIRHLSQLTRSADYFRY